MAMKLDAGILLGFRRLANVSPIRNVTERRQKFERGFLRDEAKRARAEKTSSAASHLGLALDSRRLLAAVRKVKWRAWAARMRANCAIRI
jgi:hypothetical protein